MKKRKTRRKDNMKEYKVGIVIFNRLNIKAFSSIGNSQHKTICLQEIGRNCPICQRSGDSSVFVTLVWFGPRHHGREYRSASLPTWPHGVLCFRLVQNASE